MRETFSSWVGHKLFGRTSREFVLNNEDKRQNQIEDDKMRHEECRRLAELEAERHKNPIKCHVCSEREGKDIFFEGLSWFHCPKCDKHGYPSMKGEVECTACANMRLFGHPVSIAR